MAFKISSKILKAIGFNSFMASFLILLTSTQRSPRAYHCPNLYSQLFCVLLNSSTFFSTLLRSSQLFCVLLNSSAFFSTLLRSSQLFYVLLNSSTFFSTLLRSSQLFCVLLNSSAFFSTLLHSS